jgi:hypothetical protein
MTNPQKGIWSFYNSRHDQSTMGIDPMNNISNNNKNTLCSYIILTSKIVRELEYEIGEGCKNGDALKAHFIMNVSCFEKSKLLECGNFYLASKVRMG